MNGWLRHGGGEAAQRRTFRSGEPSGSAGEDCREFVHVDPTVERSDDGRIYLAGSAACRADIHPALCVVSEKGGSHIWGQSLRLTPTGFGIGIETPMPRTPPAADGRRRSRTVGALPEAIVPLWFTRCWCLCGSGVASHF